MALSEIFRTTLFSHKPLHISLTLLKDLQSRSTIKNRLLRRQGGVKTYPPASNVKYFILVKLGLK